MAEFIKVADVDDLEDPGKTILEVSDRIGQKIIQMCPGIIRILFGQISPDHIEVFEKLRVRCAGGEVEISQQLL